MWPPYPGAGQGGYWARQAGFSLSFQQHVPAPSQVHQQPPPPVQQQGPVTSHHQLPATVHQAPAPEPAAAPAGLQQWTQVVVGQQTYWVPKAYTLPLVSQQSSPLPYQQSNPVTYRVETAEGLRQQQILSMSKYLTGNEVEQTTHPKLLAGALYRATPASGTAVPVTSLPFPSITALP